MIRSFIHTPLSSWLTQSTSTPSLMSLVTASTSPAPHAWINCLFWKKTWCIKKIVRWAATLTMSPCKHAKWCMRYHSKLVEWSTLMPSTFYRCKLRKLTLSSVSSLIPLWINGVWPTRCCSLPKCLWSRRASFLSCICAHFYQKSWSLHPIQVASTAN